MDDYTTTPELRVGPGPPYTNTSLEINLVFRVSLGIVATLLCYVPMRLLWKSGEFSAAMFCITTMALNLFYVINALIWRDDDVQNWFAGYGWCDLQIYVVFAVQTLYSASIFAIMRNLASKVGMMRATSLTASEKRRRNITESLIMFPLPLLQILLTYFVLAQRYNVSTLIGCTNSYDKTWLYVIFYHLPTPAFAILTVIFAVLTWIRFREVEKSTSAARNNNNGSMNRRHLRIRRKLFLMTMVILVPFFPMQMFWLYSNIVSGLNDLQPYDFHRIHSSGTFNLVTFTTSDKMSFVEMNMNYVAILSVIPIAWFFAATKDAINTYRVYLLALGMGRFFPKLHVEYEPDRTRSSGPRSWGQQISNILKSSNGRSSSSRKNSILPTIEHISHATTTTSTTSTARKSHDFESKPQLSTLDSNAWPDVTRPEPTHYSDPEAADNDDTLHAQPRNPFIFRIMLGNIPPIPICRRKDADRSASAPPPQLPLNEYGVSSFRHQQNNHSGSDTKSLVGTGLGTSQDGEDALPWTVVDGTVAVRGAPSQAKIPKVRTRVWAEDEECRRGTGEKPSSAAKGQKGDKGDIGVAVGGSGVMVETRIARREESL